jgi:hypothetical protein
VRRISFQTRSLSCCQYPMRRAFCGKKREQQKNIHNGASEYDEDTLRRVFQRSEKRD